MPPFILGYGHGVTGPISYTSCVLDETLLPLRHRFNALILYLTHLLILGKTLLLRLEQCPFVTPRLLFHALGDTLLEDTIYSYLSSQRLQFLYFMFINQLITPLYLRLALLPTLAIVQPILSAQHVSCALLLDTLSQSQISRNSSMNLFLCRRP